MSYRDDKTKEVVEQRKGKITEYQELLKRYEDELPRARQAFEHQHLDVQWERDSKAAGRAGQSRPRASTPISSRKSRS